MMSPGHASGEFGIPICNRCLGTLHRGWWRSAMRAVSVCCAVAGVFAVSVTDDTLARWVTVGFVGGPIGVIVAKIFADIAARPYQFRTLDAARDIAKIRFRNDDYNRLVIESVLAVQNRVIPLNPETHQTAAQVTQA